MLNLIHLRQAIDAYSNQEASIDEFADWFRAASRLRFDADEPAQDAISKIDDLFSLLYHNEISEQEFSRSLHEAIRPFLSSYMTVYGIPAQIDRSSTRSLVRAYAATA